MLAQPGDMVKVIEGSTDPVAFPAPEAQSKPTLAPNSRATEPLEDRALTADRGIA
jgi:hypothetical protein